MVVLEPVVEGWPDAARVALRRAVLADVDRFSPGAWDPIEVQVNAEIYLARWQRGQPWPPDPSELVPPLAPASTHDRAHVAVLAARIRALGLPLALGFG